MRLYFTINSFSDKISMQLALFEIILNECIEKAAAKNCVKTKCHDSLLKSCYLRPMYY